MKLVYTFDEANPQDRDWLGNKGAGLAEMTRAGLPVPPGFTITTEACRVYNDTGRKWPEGLWEQILVALKKVEEDTGKKLGDPSNPLLVSVRSGAKVSMPGMMDTILNLGLNDQTLAGLIRLTGNTHFAYDTYRRFIQMFERVVLHKSAFSNMLEILRAKTGVDDDSGLSLEQLRGAIARCPMSIPSDPYEQLRLAINAVFASWNTRRAIDYRNFHGIPHDLGTAVNVVTMVFGNMGSDSGTGVAFTRDPATGEKRLYGEYLTNAQGEDVVAGIRTPQKIATLAQEMPDIYREFDAIAQRLETHYRDAQDMEFTVERGKLYMLQTRNAKRTAQAAVKIAVEMANEGLITREEALRRVDLGILPSFISTSTGGVRPTPLARGINASPGVASGKIVFTSQDAVDLAARKERVLLVRPETSPDDISGLVASTGILTANGGTTSHAAVVARALGKPCVVGLPNLKIDILSGMAWVNGRPFRGYGSGHKEEDLTIDGSTGEVFAGAISLASSQFLPEVATILAWAAECPGYATN